MMKGKYLTKNNLGSAHEEDSYVRSIWSIVLFYLRLSFFDSITLCYSLPLSRHPLRLSPIKVVFQLDFLHLRLSSVAGSFT